MYFLDIKSKLEIRTYDRTPNLTIPVKSGTYRLDVKREELVVTHENSNAIDDEIKWEYVGDSKFASLYSDIIFVSIQDSNSKKDRFVDIDEIIDSVENFQSFGDFVLFEIPIGNGGGLAAYTTKDKNENIIAVKINGIFLE